MVPEGWERKEIGEVCAAIVDCVNKTATVVDGPTPFRMIRTTNVRHGRVDTENVRYVTEETFRTWTRRGELRDGDIILTREAPVGEVGQLRNAAGMFLGQRTMVYRAEPKRMDQQFLFQTMISPNLQRQYHADSAGGTVAHIRVPDCSKFVLNVPPLPEQRKIAEILSTWDRAIETSEALLATARTQKRALMQILLTGKRRFPEFEGQDWREVRLGDVLEINYGKSPKDIVVNDGELPILGTGGVTGKTNTAMAEGPAIVVGRKGTIDSPQWVEGKFWCIDTTYYCVSKSDVDLRWIFYWLGSIDLKLYNEASGVPSLSRDTLRAIRLKLPKPVEQARIAEVFVNCDREIGSLLIQIEKLRTEKKALMQQLLTGKRRVVVG